VYLIRDTVKGQLLLAGALGYLRQGDVIERILNKKEIAK